MEPQSAFSGDKLFKTLTNVCPFVQMYGKILPLSNFVSVTPLILAYWKIYDLDFTSHLVSPQIKKTNKKKP